MSCLLIGYRMENGSIIPDETDAEKVRLLFDLCLQGLSSYAAWRKAGIGKSHSTAIGILRNRAYTGEDGYPRLISDMQFQLVQETLDVRCEYYRSIRKKKETVEPAAPGEFFLEKAEFGFEDPRQQAEYIYSLIRRK